MGFFLFLSVWLILFLLTGASKYLLELSLETQKICLSFFSDRDWVLRHLLDASICGYNSPINSIRQEFDYLGISHILVVSGAHFQFLLQILQRFTFLKNKTGSLLLFLGSYTLATGAEPPVLRAWFQLLLGFLSSRLQWHLSSLLTVQIAGFLTLPMALHLEKSFSLVLSWGASLIIAIPKLSLWKQWLWIQILMAFLLEIWRTGSFLNNFLLSPLISIIILPLSTLMALTPFLDSIVWSPGIASFLSLSKQYRDHLMSLDGWFFLPQIGIFTKILILCGLSVILHSRCVLSRRLHHVG